ncbi:MAG: Poly(3-hydroxybutyrate) depolymerase-like protein [Xanthobacteraceae bacterium]|jgi:polyhydroxybutyrate depolymerase|nr:Poly(3-hydroxybutyrate) depolymerase-like protein [Xanthobacteraceae bacterium]
MRFAKPSVLLGAMLLAAAVLPPALPFLATPAAAQAVNTERAIVSGGLRREYILHVPRNAPPGPKPLVIALHGALQPAGMMQRYLDLDQVADREGFVVAYPKGMNLLWNDGRSSIAGFIPLLHRRDDARFVIDVMDKLVADGIADRSRSYLMGFSNGGFLTAFVACRYADRFAAFATMMMTVPVGYQQSCKPSKPVPILLMNGTYDPIVPMFGRPTPGAQLMSAGSTASLFARLDGCKAPEQVSAPNARIWRWKRCAPGGEVAYYEIAGGHQPPSSSTGVTDALASVLLGPRRSGLDAPEEIWSFFKRYGGPRPGQPAEAEPQIAAAGAAAPAGSPAASAALAEAPALAMAPLPPPRPVIEARPIVAQSAAAQPLAAKPILARPDSAATAWQGIAPAQAQPAATTVAVAREPLPEAQIPALHRPMVAGATMPLQTGSFVPADGAASAATQLASAPRPPRAPVRQHAASVQ